MRKTKRTITLTAVLTGMMLASAACNLKPKNDGDPKGVITGYISRSFSVKSAGDRTELLSYLTNEAKARLSAWSDDQFREAFVESKRQFGKLVFTEMKNVSPSEMSVTYELTYTDQAKGHGAKVTQKKLAQMVQNGGKWYIADVKNIKELVEYKNEMSLP